MMFNKFTTLSLIFPRHLRCARSLRGLASLALPQARAAHFLELAAEAEHAEALADLGAARFAGSDGFSVDLSGALAAFERAADAGAAAPGAADDARVAALLSAGAMYARGLGTPVNFRAALARYQAAAQLNSVEAWENIAAMHARGQGVPRDEKAARGILDMAQRLRAELEAPAPAAGPTPPAASDGAATTAACANAACKTGGCQGGKA
jgi:TPR repeat protein